MASIDIALKDIFNSINIALREENQELRDRLAHALWENRRLKRQQRLDDQFAWRLTDIEQRMKTWEADS